ncbi:MarR family winged helix-turn-helix transcriptional regulator [Deinococcus puniceus]|uniref:MarR family transcriptional regulator n=1 Tax=Deinococcus puniceus TaxID=1182568 RepID=A0A172TA01_9DEIO|nr:MarR family transcriptional regulator [Deinococcus puniceus]ANE43839.1 MarR family transcriptional regulator [Deinococcus puniceus]
MTDIEPLANAPNAETPNNQAEASAENRAAAVHLGQAMKRLHRHISSRVMTGMQDELQERDLSFTQIAALHQLRALSPLTVTQLSERARLSVPAASHLVERLVQRGLAGRQENPENRREKLVALTADGRDVLTRMDAGFVDAYISVFSTLPAESIHAADRAIRTLLDQLDLNDPALCSVHSSQTSLSEPAPENT